MAGYYDRDKAPNDGTSTYTVGGNLGWPRPHLNHVPEYQASGVPFVQKVDTSSATSGDVYSVTFPAVTRWIIVGAHTKTGNLVNDEVRMGFGLTGVQASNYVDIQTVTTERLELKTNKLYFRIGSANVDHIEIIAGLTNIQASDLVFGTSQEGINANATITVELNTP